MQKQVAIRACDTYQIETVNQAILALLSDIGIDESKVSGKKVVIKPNFVSPKTPEKAATTHPSFLEATARIFKSMNPASLLIAECCGGPLTQATLKTLYKTCGADIASQNAGVPLNEDIAFENVKQPNGIISHDFLFLKPFVEADIIVDLCKLKTHTLTKLSCATKNFFGTIPGIHKFEMHARFPEQKDFQNMLIDLCSYYTQSKTVICICDAVDAMEGNGPTNGTPRHMGLTLSSLSPYALDVAAEHLLGFDGTVSMCDYMAERSLTPRHYEELEILGDDPEPYIAKDWKQPDSSSKSAISVLPKLFGGKLARALSPKPVINKKKCVACGRCKDSCPVHTIEIIEKHGKKRAYIHSDKCIHCFCCQELCPFDAVNISKNGIIQFIH